MTFKTKGKGNWRPENIATYKDKRLMILRLSNTKRTKRVEEKSDATINKRNIYHAPHKSQVNSLPEQKRKKKSKQN